MPRTLAGLLVVVATGERGRAAGAMNDFVRRRLGVMD